MLGINRAQAIGHIFLLWENLASLADDSCLLDLTPWYVSELCQWEGDELEFFKSLQECGWIRNNSIEFNGCAHFVSGRVKRTGRYLWRKLRLKILSRDNYKCKYCGIVSLNMQVDHIKPVSKGGNDDESNLVAACLKCNSKKNNNRLKDFLNAIS